MFLKIEKDGYNHLIISYISCAISLLLREKLKNNIMRLIKVTGGLGNQMFIYAMFMSMRKKFPKTRLDISDVSHYKVHYGYEMNEVFNLPKEEVCIWWGLKKILEILFFKVIIERKQKGSMKPYVSRFLWPFVYFKGFYQSERYFLDVQDEVRRSFSFDLKRASIKTLFKFRK